MTTFFEKLRRMMKGEPVYRPGDERDDGPVYEYPDEMGDRTAAPQAQQQTSPVANAEITKDNKQNPPVVLIDRFECHENPDRLEVNVFLKNTFSEEVLVDKIHIFGHPYHIDHDLAPGESREFMVYNGPYLKDSSYTHAEVQYRDSRGDYFSARHTLEFKKEGDYKFVPVRSRFFPPVKDI